MNAVVFQQFTPLLDDLSTQSSDTIISKKISKYLHTVPDWTFSQWAFKGLTEQSSESLCEEWGVYVHRKHTQKKKRKKGCHWSYKCPKLSTQGSTVHKQESDKVFFCRDDVGHRKAEECGKYSEDGWRDMLHPSQVLLPPTSHSFSVPPLSSVRTNMLTSPPGTYLFPLCH